MHSQLFKRKVQNYMGTKESSEYQQPFASPPLSGEPKGENEPEKARELVNRLVLYHTLKHGS
jgi:hypothetical protein